MRSPRRSFAAPFVITVVGAAGCTMSSPPPQNPDPNTGGGGTVTTPGGEVEQRWTVFKSGDGCMAGIAVSCPPTATCNPPRPVAYACPENLSFERPVEIVKYAGADTCQSVPVVEPCPPNVACNPPRPQTVPCPGL